MSDILRMWRDAAWKEVMSASAENLIEYLLPELAADMDHSREITGIPGIELFPETDNAGSHMRRPDVFFDVPMRGGENGNIALFAEQQHDEDMTIPRRVFETYIRLREKWRQRVTCFVIYTGSAPNVNTYSESCYGFKVSVEFKTLYLPGMDIDELRADKRPFARVALAGRLSLEAGDDLKLREKYAMEILNTADGAEYDNKAKSSILKFSKRIFRLSDPKISKELKEAYEMKTLPLTEYAQQIELENAKIISWAEGMERGKEEGARAMLAHGMPIHEVAKIIGFPVSRLENLSQHP